MSQIQSRYSRKYKFFIWILLIVIGGFFIFTFGIESIFTSGNNQKQENSLFSINGKTIYNEPGSIVSEIYRKTVNYYRSMGMNIDENDPRYANILFGQAISEAKNYLLQFDYAEENKLFLSDEELLYFLRKKRDGDKSVLDFIKDSLKGYSKANQIALGKQEYYRVLIKNAYLDYTAFLDLPISPQGKKIISNAYSVRKKAVIAFLKFEDKQLINNISLTDLKKYYDVNKQGKYQNKKYEEISASIIQDDYLKENRELIFNKVSLPIRTKLEKEIKKKKFRNNFVKVAKKLKLNIIRTEVGINSDKLVDSNNQNNSIEQVKKFTRVIMMTPNSTNTSIFIDNNLMAIALVNKVNINKVDNIDQIIEEKKKKEKNLERQLFINSLKKKAKIIDINK